MTYTTARSTPATRFPVEEKKIEPYANFKEALAAMKKDAKKMRSFRQIPKNELVMRLSPLQARALKSLEGDMCTNTIGERMGYPNAAGPMSGLCEKGYVERIGFGYRGITIWRKTQKGLDWLEGD